MYCIQVVFILLVISCFTKGFLPQHRQKRDSVEQPNIQVNAKAPIHPAIDLTNSAGDKQALKPIPNNSPAKITRNNSTSNITSNHIENINNNKVIGQLNNNGMPEENSVELESGAITRGILVFVGISFLFILYVGFKTYRRRKQDKSRSMVRKYGIRTNKSDLEMEPLPLSDDDEDETVFDLSASSSGVPSILGRGGQTYGWAAK